MRYSLASMVGMATTFFYTYSVLFHFPNKSILSLPCFFLRLQCIIKQLSDSVFVICKIINVSPLARLITLTSTLIIPHITKTSSNNCLLYLDILFIFLKAYFILYYVNKIFLIFRGRLYKKVIKLNYI